MKVSTGHHNDVFVIALTGKIMGGEDTTSFYEAVNSAVAENKKKVVLDLQGVDWMNSSGLGMLIAGSARLTNVAGVMKLARPNEIVAKLLTLNKLDQILEIHPSITAAASSF
jgi:anti-sigma B factor antagonist